MGMKLELFLLSIHKKMYMDDKITGCSVIAWKRICLEGAVTELELEIKRGKRAETLLCDYKANNCR